MQDSAPAAAQQARPLTPETAVMPVILALSFSHLLNDMMQSLLPAIYPIIKSSYALDFGQIGMLTLAFQMTASIFQPLVGFYTDRHPQPYSLVAGMGLSLAGLVLLAYAGSYAMLLLGAALIGTGSSIFHPESVRMARFASGGRHGFAQSLFQVGGQAGQAAGPLLAAFVVAPAGQRSLAWFSVVALLGMVVLYQVCAWHRREAPPRARTAALQAAGGKPSGAVIWATAIVVALMLSKSAYTASLTSYYTFYLIGTFHVSVPGSQILLFLFLAAQVAGSLAGGHYGDRIGRRQIIWLSILGAIPFTLLLPHANLFWTGVLTVIIGFIMASAFPALLVYALELLPGNVGTIAGIFYGLSFGLGALSAALFGQLADATSLAAVYGWCAYLPLIGLLTWFLPVRPGGVRSEP